MKTLVLGVGNLLRGDDRAGLAVLHRLTQLGAGSAVVDLDLNPMDPRDRVRIAMPA